MRLQLSRKSSVKLFIGAKSRLWALIDQLLTPGLSLGGEITSDQADDYKSRLFATYQGLDDGHKREKSNPHRTKIGPHPTQEGQYNLIEATLDLFQVSFNPGG